MQMDGNVMRMRAVAAIDLPARTEVRLRHGSAAAASEGHHLMLNGLKAPLKDGDRFAVVLQFRRAGEREVMVWVQTPKSRDVGHGGSHQH
jgi:copper(I)-binding protein